MSNNELVEKARTLSAKLFSSSPRLSGDTAYDHAQRVFNILIENSIKDELTLSAALLHPLADVEFKEKDIDQEFGQEITTILKNYVGLKKSKIDKDTPRAYNEAFFIQAFFKLSKDMRTLVIRLADRLDNLKTSYALPQEKRTRAAQKVLYLYALVAKSVGLGNLSRKLEDEAFKILSPREYKLIEKALNIKIHDANKIMLDAEQFLKDILEENNIEAKISVRYKHIYSIYRKIKLQRKVEKNFAENLNNLHDIVAMRIIVNTIDDCYRVENILNDMWDTAEEREDYIAKPRPSGYQSIHGHYKIDKDIIVEVQIRTHDMHDFNEYGPASHLLYKIGDKGAESPAYKKLLTYTKDNKYWFKDLNWQRMESLDVEKQANVPFAQKIYCFTPKGDIMELEKDATLIDFAYAVHTDLGNKCAGGYVNGQFIALDHILKDGDLIEVKTLKKNNVNTDWIKIAKSARTRAHIRKALQKT